MCKITSVFAYLACTSHGHQAQIMADEFRIKQFAFADGNPNLYALAKGRLRGREGNARAVDPLDAAKAFAEFILALHPAVAFIPFSSGMPTVCSGFVCKARPLPWNRMPAMAISDEAKPEKSLTRRTVINGGLVSVWCYFAYKAALELGLDYPVGPEFDRYIPNLFIAALGDPEASSGTGAEKWGIWRKDPGPRGVFLGDYEKDIAARGATPAGIAPEGWTFDPSRWWVEEHGLIMETPAPLPLQRFERNGDDMKVLAQSKRYIVSGGRETKSVLTVHSDGRWELSNGKLYDVTHLPCRSAVYTPATGGECKPTEKEQSKFPVKPGALMPEFDGCNKQDWAVLFLVAEEK